MTDKEQALKVAHALLGSPNKVQCRICEDIIESKHNHDWVACKGGHIFIDGGPDRMNWRSGILGKGATFEDIVYVG